MKSIFLIPSTILLVLATYIDTPAQTSTLTREFPMLYPAQNLHEVKGQEGYVLHASFENGDLRKVQVVPKFFYRRHHPDWTEPTTTVTMSKTEYENTLQKIYSARPIGSLVQEGPVGTMFNLKLNFTDEYDTAMVVRAMFRNSADEQYKVAWFEVNYFHAVSGKVEAKETGIDGAHRIKIAGCWYWTRANHLDRATHGNAVALELAGPISETPGCRGQQIQ